MAGAAVGAGEAGYDLVVVLAAAGPTWSCRRSCRWRVGTWWFSFERVWGLFGAGRGSVGAGDGQAGVGGVLVEVVVDDDDRQMARGEDGRGDGGAVTAGAVHPHLAGGDLAEAGR